MRFFGHAIALFLVAGGSAWGAGLPQWRDWSKPVILVGGSPFERAVAIDEEVRLQRRADPILETIGESALSMQFGSLKNGGAGIRGATGIYYGALSASPQSTDETPTQRKGKDIEQMMRDLGLGSAGKDGKKGSIANLAINGNDNDEGTSSKWGWLADEVRGDDPYGLMPTETTDQAAQANGQVLDDIENSIGEITDTASSRPSDSSRDNRTTSAKNDDKSAGRLDAGMITPPGSSGELRGTQDLMSKLADKAATASASAPNSTSPAIADLVGDEATKSFAPDWNSLLSGGKTVDWREAAGLSTKGPTDFASTPTGPSSADTPSSAWSRSASSGSASISSPSAMLTSTGSGTPGSDPSSIWGSRSGSDAPPSWSSFGTGGSAGNFGNDGWSAPSTSFGSGNLGGFGTGTFGVGGGNSASAPSFGGNAYPGGYRVPDAGAVGVQTRDTMKGLAGGGMKPAWY